MEASEFLNTTNHFNFNLKCTKITQSVTLILMWKRKITFKVGFALQIAARPTQLVGQAGQHLHQDCATPTSDLTPLRHTPQSRGRRWGYTVPCPSVIPPKWLCFKGSSLWGLSRNSDSSHWEMRLPPKTPKMYNGSLCGLWPAPGAVNSDRTQPTHFTGQATPGSL